MYPAPVVAIIYTGLADATRAAMTAIYPLATPPIFEIVLHVLVNFGGSQPVPMNA